MLVWVEESFGSTLAAWIDFKRKHPTACSHFMTTLLRQDIYLEHRFVTLIWAFEVLHRGLFPSDHRNLEERVSEVMTVLEGKLNSRKREWVERKLSRLEEISLEQRIDELLEDLPIAATREAVRRFAGSLEKMATSRVRWCPTPLIRRNRSVPGRLRGQQRAPCR
jgi:hypothetical protein